MLRKNIYLVLCLSTLLLISYFLKKQSTGNQGSGNKTLTPESIVWNQFAQLNVPECKNNGSLQNTTIKSTTNWQKVGKDSEWHIFSAYIDDRLERPLVRILALSRAETEERLFCKVWTGPTTFSITEAEKQELWLATWNSSKKGKYYRPFLLTCSSSEDPIAVSVIKSCDQIENLFHLTLDKAAKSDQKNFAVCLKPLNFDRDISIRLLEWLELQFLLGAHVLLIYTQKLHPRTSRILEHYREIGKVRIKQYNPPGNALLLTAADELWQKRRHEMVIYNDCLYDLIHTHRYVINIDLDEAIVPVSHPSWLGMLNYAAGQNPRLREAASMGVRNVYFFEGFGRSNETSLPNHMYMLSHINRSSNFTPPGFAQKSFFRTNSTLVATNHFALKTVRPNTYALVGIDEQHAHLHHYRRDCPPLMEKDCEENYMKYRTTDKTLWKYKDELVKRVQTKATEIGLRISGNPVDLTVH